MKQVAFSNFKIVTPSCQGLIIIESNGLYKNFQNKLSHRDNLYYSDGTWGKSAESFEMACLEVGCCYIYSSGLLYCRPEDYPINLLSVNLYSLLTFVRHPLSPAVQHLAREAELPGRLRNVSAFHSTISSLASS